MWSTLILVLVLSFVMSKLVSGSAVWRFKTAQEKLVHLVKFSLAYPIYLVMFGKRRRQKRTVQSVETAKKMVPIAEDWTKESPLELNGKNEMDAIQFIGMDKHGNSCFVSLTHKPHQTEVWLVVRYQGQIYTLPDHPATVQGKYDNEKRVFIGKGLRFELREPCKKWRVWINTTVKKGTANAASKDETDLVHLKLNGWWAANTDVFDFDADHDASLVAKSLARSSWSQELFQLVSKVKPRVTNQWGQLIGQMKITSGNEVLATEISMHCLKSRISANVSWNALTKFNVHVAAFEDGTYLLIGSLDAKGILKSFGFGYVAWTNGSFTPVTDTNLLYEETPNPDLDTAFMPFSSGGKHLLLRVHKEATVPLQFSGDGGQSTSLRVTRLDLNGKNGFGFNLLSSSKWQPLSELPHDNSLETICRQSEYRYTSEEASQYVLPLSHRAASSSDLSGGKGCNLARLCQLQGEFTVPTGFSVTTAAYVSYINDDPRLKSLVVKLENYGQFSPEELEETCHQIEKLLEESEISKKLKSAIEHELNRCFGSFGWADKKFAVRSSAVGEDSSDLSTAGQLETYLDRKGLDSICHAVHLCWASQFRLPAVQYRKQHGQPLTHPVAVVVQEMVDSEVSGVLFTVDPVDGNPLRMIINANPGLGELVVSGAVTPDTITLDRSYYRDTVTWRKVELGNEANETCCLDEALAVKLGQIGILIEQALNGKPKDIEWAVHGGIIYLLQARDITSLETETEYDLMHEFDDAIRNDDDCYTTANVGEVMAEPQTPLSLSTQVSAIDIAGHVTRSSRGLDTKHYVRTMLHVDSNRALFNMMETLYKEIGYMEDTRVPEICFMGHPLNMPEIKKVAVDRYGVPSGLEQIRRAIDIMVGTLFVVPSIQEKETKRFDTFKIDAAAEQDPKSLYEKISSALQELANVWSYHLFNSMASSFGYNFVAAVLLPRDPKEELTADHYSDIATLFSSCQNVVSADVPAALKDLGLSISKAGRTAQFREMRPEDAIEWLNGQESGEAGTKFQEFMAKHGHRSIAEIDIGATSWKSDPKPLIVTLQSMVRDETSLLSKKEDLSVEQAIGKLKSIGFIQRQLLNLIVPIARTGVVRREHSKNIAIKVTDVLRRAYRQLGALLANQGYLPDRELIFYLSHIEIGDLIQTRPAKLVAKAVRRRKLMNTLRTFHYPEIMIGQPKPIEQKTQKGHSNASVVIKGTPVSQGVAEGPVRVAKRLTDAKDTQPGEILIATSTDIGWSPYFPMLAGVVTELGGLLSHGAVVAREYGLPCIVNAQNATELFSTGDIARLDASAGILKKL